MYLDILSFCFNQNQVDENIEVERRWYTATETLHRINTRSTLPCHHITSHHIN